MTERLHPPHIAANAAPAAPPEPNFVVSPEEQATILGFPAEVVPDEEREDSGDGDGPFVDPDIVLVALRRPDRFAAAALLLSGLAAGVSLLLPWGPGEAAGGLALVQQGLDALEPGVGALSAGGAWAPLAVVVGGGVLAVLGLLALVPARGHRFIGVLALLVASAAVPAVVVLLVEAGWRVERSELGMWFAVAVPGLGILGALKAMLTPPRITVERR